MADDTIHIVEASDVCFIPLMKERSFTVPISTRELLDIKPGSRFVIYINHGDPKEFALWVHLTAHNRVHIDKDAFYGLSLKPGQKYYIRVMRPARY